MANIVLLDDDEDLLKMLSYAFGSHDHEVKSFSSGKTALEYFANEKNLKNTDLFLLDRILRDADGVDVLKEIQSKYEKKDIPIVIFLTVLSAEKDMLEGLDAGAVEYLTKPFSLAVLLDRCQALLSKFGKKKT
jgi:two-component system alkaline phosphatase synthesis response regulator PhoP